MNNLLEISILLVSTIFDLHFGGAKPLAIILRPVHRSGTAYFVKLAEWKLVI
jgi:hypothetical protein